MPQQPALQWPLVRPGNTVDPAYDPCGAGPIPKPEPDEGEGDDAA